MTATAILKIDIYFVAAERENPAHPNICMGALIS